MDLRVLPEGVDEFDQFLGRSIDFDEQFYAALVILSFHCISARYVVTDVRSGDSVAGGIARVAALQSDL